MKTRLQECAKFILENPGCDITDISGAIDTDNKTVRKLVKIMINMGAATRTGAGKKYRYFAGEHINTAIEAKVVVPGKRKPPLKPRLARNNMMEIKQVWLRQDDYTIEPGEMIYRSVWNYAGSFR